MTIAELKQYRNICAEIQDLEDDLNVNHYVGDTVQSATRFPHKNHNVHIEGYKPDGGTVAKLARLAERKKQRDSIDQFVESISDYKLKKAVKLYYINPIEDGEDKPTWEMVVDEIGQGATSESIRQTVMRYIKNFK